MNAIPDRPLRTRDEARALFRKAILDAAEEVFAESGFHGARIQDIATRARIAVGTVYNHFAQKDDLLKALLEERSDELLSQLRPREGDPEAFRARLEVRIERMLGYIERHRAFFAIANEHGLFGSAAPGARLEARPAGKAEKFRAGFRELVEEGVASSELESFDAEVLARFLGSTMRGFVLTSLEGGVSDAKADAAMTVELFLHGASRREPSSG